MTRTGERLKELRKNRGWSQLDVANKIGVGRTTYLKYETGENKPVRKIRELAELFGVSYDYLLDNEANGKRLEEHLSEDEIKLVRNYRWLDDDGKNIILNVIGRFIGMTLLKPNKFSIVKKNSENGNNYGVVGGDFNSTVNLK